MKTPEQIAEIREKAMTKLHRLSLIHDRYLDRCGAAWQKLYEVETDDEITLACMVYYLLAVEEIGK